MDVFWTLAQSLPFTLGLIAVALLILLFELGRRLARAAELASDTIDDASRLEVASENGDMAVVDLRSSPAVAALKQSFTRAGHLLSQMLPGGRPQYQTPWFLSLGPAGGGKTTLLGQTRLVLPLGEPDTASGTAPAGCNWWLFDRAVALDVAGDFVLQSAGLSSDQAAWRRFLELLRRYRHRRPADGVVLALPASELLAFEAGDPDAQDAVAERASVLRRKLQRAQERLGMRLPVYVVVTKCDLVPGFRRFVELLGPERRGQIFGWSSPDPPEATYTGGWVDTAFTGLDRDLIRFQLRALALAAGERAENRDFIAFPAAIARLKEPLRIYMNQVFSASAASEPFPFRGLYFCGASGLGAEVEDSPHRLAAAAGGWSEDGRGGDRHRRIDFLTDLFDGKILYEWNLARPTDKAQRGARRRAWTLQAVLVAGLLLGPVALWAGVRLSSSRAETLDQGLLAPIVGTLQPGETGETTSEQLAERARLALRAAAEVPDYRMHTSLLPWGGHADRELATAMTSVYGDTVLPATREALDRQLGQPMALPVAASAPIWNVETVPEFGSLQARTARLGELARDVDRYNCFTPAPCRVVAANELEIFRRLIESVHRTPWRIPTRPAQRFYAGVLESVSVAPYSAAPYRPALQQETLSRSAAMLHRLYGDNAVVLGLDDLVRRIAQLTVQPPAASAVAEALRQLLAAIERTKNDLSRPELAWIGSATLDLGDSFDAWLAAVMTSELLGRATAAQIRRHADAGFVQLRQRLAETSSTVGPLLATSDGHLLLQLSPQMLALESGLRGLFAQGFMTAPAGPRITIDPSPGTALFWSSQPLQEAAAVDDAYRSFTAEGLAGFAALEPTVVRVSRAAVEAQILDRVARAQTFHDVPDLFTKALLESHIVEQVANLQSVSATLEKLLGALEAPPAAALAGDCAGYCTSRSATAWCQLSAVLESQQRDLLQELDDLLGAQALYTPIGGDFSWWDGTGHLALQAFGVASDDDLATYLAAQQRQVKTLAEQYAQPVLTATGTTGCWGFTSQTEFLRFKVILSDLADVESQTPANAVAQLEDFISTTMAATTLDNCRGEVPSGGTCFAPSTPVDLKVKPPCDYFLVQRDSLVRGIEGRCEQLTVDAARSAWTEIAHSFANRLLGKFPFIAEPSQPLKQEATAADLENFLKVFDRQRALVESFLGIADRRAAERPPPFSADGVDAVRRFMTAMAGVRELFAPFLAARADSAAAVPVFDLQVQFRVNRAMEADANQILGWTLTVGDSEIEPGDIDPPGRWTYGQPVRLKLAWAANAPTAPLAPDEPGVRLVGKSLIYEYRNAWSLVSLMKQHAAAAEDFADFQDSDPETLLFEIPTVHSADEAATGEPAKRSRSLFRFLFKSSRDPAQSADSGEAVAQPASAAAADFTTRAFIRITLMSPDGTKAELPFPDFPTAVPPFPPDAGAGAGS